MIQLRADPSEYLKQLRRLDRHLKRGGWVHCRGEKAMAEYQGNVRSLAILGALGVLSPGIPTFRGRGSRAYATGQGDGTANAVLSAAQVQGQRPSRAPTAGRNEPCPCGSGRKYKKCCRP